MCWSNIVIVLMALICLVQPSQQDHLVIAEAKVSSSDEIKRYEDYKKSIYFVPTFDPEVISVPKAQHDFFRNVAAANLDLFRTILKEAIDKRDSFAPSVGLVLKYSGKLLDNFIRNRQAERRLSPKIEPKQSFFRMIADTTERIIDRSKEIKKQKGYTKNSVNTEDLYRRVDNLFNYVQATIDASPVGAYIKWDEMVVFRNDHSNPSHDRILSEEAAELAAEFRAMGYEKCVFVAKRIVNLLRMFARGFIPSRTEDVS